MSPPLTSLAVSPEKPPTLKDEKMGRKATASGTARVRSIVETTTEELGYGCGDATGVASVFQEPAPLV